MKKRYDEEKEVERFFPLLLLCLSSSASRCLLWSSVCRLQQRSVLKRGGSSQTGMGLKEPYCEVTYFPNAGRRRTGSWWNYPHESYPLWCPPRLRTWKGIRWGRALSASGSDAGQKQPDSRSHPRWCGVSGMVEFLHCHVLLLKGVMQPSCLCTFPSTPVLLSVHFLPSHLPRDLCGRSWSSGNIRLHLLKHVRLCGEN